MASLKLACEYDDKTSRAKAGRIPSVAYVSRNTCMASTDKHSESSGAARRSSMEQSGCSERWITTVRLCAA